MKAAVESYFGIPLEELTPAQAAIIAGLPKSPSNYDLVRNAVERCKADVAEDAECPVADTELVVPTDTTVVERRDTILGLLAEGRTPMSGRPVQRGRLPRGGRRGGPPRPPDDATLDRARTSSGPSSTSWRSSCALTRRPAIASPKAGSA